MRIELLQDFGFYDVGRNERGELAFAKLLNPARYDDPPADPFDYHVRYGPYLLASQAAPVLFIGPLHAMQGDCLIEVAKVVDIARHSPRARAFCSTFPSTAGHYIGFPSPLGDGNYLFIPKYGLMGAAWASAFTAIALALSQLVLQLFLTRSWLFARPLWRNAAIALLLVLGIGRQQGGTARSCCCQVAWPSRVASRRRCAGSELRNAWATAGWRCLLSPKAVLDSARPSSSCPPAC